MPQPDDCIGFDWDEANVQKNWERHRITPEAEDVFFNDPLVVHGDIRHSQGEKRYYVLGQTTFGRYLFVAFTIRQALRSNSLSFVPKTTSAAFGPIMIRLNSLTGKPPKGAGFRTCGRRSAQFPYACPYP